MFKFKCILYYTNKICKIVCPGSKFVNPLSIDPNERVTPSHPGAMGLPEGNGYIDPSTASMDDIPDLSIAVTEIGVIPPPPMFSSPSPPPPPPPPLTSNQVTNGHVIVNHQVFHTNITVDGHDLSGLGGQENSPQQRFVIPQHQQISHPDHGGQHHQHPDDSDSDDHDEPDDDLEDEDELEDEFDDYGNAYHTQGLNTRIITTVPAKEPVYNAVPLKSALKKSKGGNNFAASAASQHPPSNKETSSGR